MQKQRTKWVEVVINGMIIGVVLSLHLWFLLRLLIPATSTQIATDTSPGLRKDALLLEFFKLPLAAPRVASATHKPSQTSLAISRISASRVKPSAMPSSLTLRKELPTTPPQPTITQLQLSLPNASAAGAYGNPAFNQGQANIPSGKAQKIPGYADGSLVRGIQLTTRTSIQSWVNKTGKFLQCSNIIIKQRLSPSELDKYHMTRFQLDKAYEALGCKPTPL